MKEIAHVRSPEEMSLLAAKVAGHLPAVAVIQLDGTLGAGKTFFVKALGAALDCAMDISSPTFPLVHEYIWPGGAIFHLDFYRIEKVDEIFAAGLDEYLPGKGITVVEWASRFPEVFPAKNWQITINITSETGREVTIVSPDP